MVIPFQTSRFGLSPKFAQDFRALKAKPLIGPNYDLHPGQGGRRASPARPPIRCADVTTEDEFRYRRITGAAAGRSRPAKSLIACFEHFERALSEGGIMRWARFEQGGTANYGIVE